VDNFFLIVKKKVALGFQIELYTPKVSVKTNY